MLSVDSSVHAKCHLLIFHISLTADVSVTNKNSAAEKQKPMDVVQVEAQGNIDDDAEDEELCSTSAVLENIPENVNQEFLEMLIENVLKDLSSSTASNFTLEVFPYGSYGVVTFQNGKGTDSVYIFKKLNFLISF